VGPDLLLLLSGHDKFRSAPVFVWVTVTYVLSGLLGLCGSGLVLHKRSGTILMLTIVAAIANIVLNRFWIPAYSYMGAVYATAASLIGLNCMQFAFCPRDLRALPGVRAVVTACGLSAVVWLVAYSTGVLGQTGHLPRLVAMTLLMLAGFVLPALALDRGLRDGIYRYWKLRRAGSPP
jgi:O-antigen/teichoic acid export membrane protein